MGMNRRGFLSLFGIGAAVAAIDPERLLWTPGRKLISIPAVRVRVIPSACDTLFAQMERIRPGAERQFMLPFVADRDYRIIGVQHRVATTGAHPITVTMTPNTILRAGDRLSVNFTSAPTTYKRG